MRTECSGGEIRIQAAGRREAVAKFDGGTITSDGGGLLLLATDRQLRLIDRLAECFEDHRNPESIEFSVRELVAQRVMALALGHEDLNDHDELRLDPLLALVVGRKDPRGEDRVRKQDRGKALAGKSTLNRMELSVPGEAKSDRYKRIVLNQEKADRLMVDLFVEGHRQAPEWIVLDLDATDDPLHGKQEGRYFHGYYGNYCYLPLYIFCGEHLLCARLRTADVDASAGTVKELERIIGQIRQKWPEVKVLVRADSGFCREEIVSWCEEQEEVHYVIGLARNERLEKQLAPSMEQARREYEDRREAVRVFAEFEYRTLDSWSRSRRVVGKAEMLAKGPNPRFVVTSLPAEEHPARDLYEKVYCARGEMENRIKEQQLGLFADRTSTATMRANQLRLTLSSFAYVLMQGLRRIGLAGSEMARAQCSTIRVRLLKIGAQVRVTVRKVWVSLSSAYPHAALFRQVYQRLSAPT